jgi:hypothetical protein
MDEWQEHCPIDEEEWPVQRQAWRSGWEYRMEHGPGKPDRETILEMVERPTLLSVWLQGFAAADNAERPA